MERAFVIRDLRSRNINFPSGWPRAQKPQQTKIIESLLQHEPSGRPKAIVSICARALALRCSLNSLATYRLFSRMGFSLRSRRTSISMKHYGRSVS